MRASENLGLSLRNNLSLEKNLKDSYKPKLADRVAITKLFERNVHLMVTLIGDNTDNDPPMWMIHYLLKVKQNSLRYSHQMDGSYKLYFFLMAAP